MHIDFSNKPRRERKNSPTYLTVDIATFSNLINEKKQLTTLESSINIMERQAGTFAYNSTSHI